MRRHGIIALEPVTDHSLLSAARKKKTKQKRKGMVQFRYIRPEALDVLNHRAIHTHTIQLKRNGPVHINAAESVHYKK